MTKSWKIQDPHHNNNKNENQGWLIELLSKLKKTQLRIFLIQDPNIYPKIENIACPHMRTLGRSGVKMTTKILFCVITLEALDTECYITFYTECTRLSTKRLVLAPSLFIFLLDIVTNLVKTNINYRVWRVAAGLTGIPFYVSKTNMPSKILCW